MLREAVGGCGGSAYHVPGLGGAAGEDQDDLGAVARVAVLKVIAPRGLAGLEVADLGGAFEGRGGHEGGREGEVAEDVGELHFGWLVEAGCVGCGVRGAERVMNE